MTARQLAVLVAIVLGTLAVVGVFIRPMIPPDETRYMTVAWEMLYRHNFILPTDNFEPYHHKPPLLFWLINLSWLVAGQVADWPVRVLACLVSATFLYSAYRTLQKIAPDSAVVAVALLLASPVFLIYSTHLLFDCLMGVFVLWAIYFLVDIARGERRGIKNWMVVGLCLGGAALAKGPVVLVHVLPFGLMMPFWAKGMMHTPTKKAWYGGLLFAVVIGFAIGFLWAIPAAIEGGKDYARMIFYGQSAGRMVKAFDHARPVYWYLPIIAAFLALPLFTTGFWRGTTRVVRDKVLQGEDLNAARILLFWFVPVFVAFSLISGKQVHYLIPALPALFGGVALAMKHGTLAPARVAWALVVICFAVTMGAAVYLSATGRIATYDLTPIGRALQALPKGTPLAVDEKYDGEYGYVGRLTAHVDVLPHNAFGPWFATHPNGVVIHRYRAGEFDVSQTPYVVAGQQVFRTKQTIILLTTKRP